MYAITSFKLSEIGRLVRNKGLPEAFSTVFDLKLNLTEPPALLIEAESYRPIVDLDAFII